MTAIRLVLEKLWRGATLNGDDIIVIILVATMVASTTHLITMIVTRWGDRYIALKSLAGSLLVHGVCLLGLEVFDPLQLQPAEISQDPPIPVEVKTEILLQSDDEVVLNDSGNTAAPDAPTESEVDQDRTPPPARVLNEPEIPEWKPENPDAVQTTLPDATHFLESPESRSTVPVEHGIRGPTEVAARDPETDRESKHERNMADVHAADTKRTLPSPGDSFTQPDPVERQATAPRTDRIQPVPKMDEASFPIATSELPDTIGLSQADSIDDPATRSAPLPGEEKIDSAGVESIVHPRAAPARTFDKRLPRPENSLPSESASRRPTPIHSPSPRTPIPLSDTYDEVREGLSAPLITDDLQSSANLVEIDIDQVRRQDQQPSAYRLRSREYRQDAVRKFGGTERSEATVERSLVWLSSMQRPDGRWDASASGAGQVESDPERKKDNLKFVGLDADTGITALVTLSFLGAGYTHEGGRYGFQVDRALDWLISQQGEDGNLAGSADYYSRMYCHGMATYALAEALGMQSGFTMGPMFDSQIEATGLAASDAVCSFVAASAGIPPVVSGTIWSASSSTAAEVKAWNSRKTDDLRLRSALLKAIRFTIRWQHSEGSWRYSARSQGDLSMFGWQLMSLKSAEIAGIEINSKVRERMERFIDSSRQGDSGGLFAYRTNEKPTPPMTAEALFCQQMLGRPRDSAGNVESVNYLLNNLPRLSKMNLYYWYYGTLAMYQHGGSAWQQWNDAVRDLLIDEQITDGPLAGSWDPNDEWGRYGGRLYSTALSTLTLEVYYRLLPLYRMGDEFPGVQDPSETGLR